MANKSEDYTPTLCSKQARIAEELTEGNIAIPGIATLLSIRCRQLLNGGRIANARHELSRPLSVGLIGLSMELAQIILAGDAPDFWHWEGDTLVVDFYSVAHEAALLAMKNGGRAGGLQSGISRNKKKGASKGASKGATNNKERNTTLTGSISKAGPSAGARGPALDGAATAAGDDEPATDEEMQAALDEMNRD